jgi:hypothetical protein
VACETLSPPFKEKGGCDYSVVSATILVVWVLGFSLVKPLAIRLTHSSTLKWQAKQYVVLSASAVHTRNTG